MPHRRDIEGLRAVAVIGIVLFHLDSKLLPGGFAGVDVFFVISGYLISRNLFVSFQAGNFSLANFYGRRARRILPALFVTLFLSTVAALFLLLPAERVDFAKSAWASALFAANIHFFAALNYFSPRAEDTPLLHIWSLGVEEQFYLLFPLLCLTFWKLRTRGLTILVVAGGIASLVASAWMVSRHPAGAFYLLPFRAFELLLGSMLALPAVRPIRHQGAATLALLSGLTGIAVAFVYFDRRTPFPGLSALLPCISTALVIQAGTLRGGLNEKVLGVNSLTLIGRMSYSLYLIHWPLIVFGLRVLPDADPTVFALTVAALSLVLAHVSYRFVEQPFRRPDAILRPKILIGGALVSVAAICGFSSVIIMNAGFSGSTDARIKHVETYLKYDPSDLWRTGRCFLERDQQVDATDLTPCLPKGNNKKILIWGDSMGIMLHSGLESTFAARGYHLGALTASVCLPVIGLHLADRPHCQPFNRKAMEIIRDERPEIVILASGWDIPPQDRQPVMALLERTALALHQMGIRTVILGESPFYKKRVPQIIIERLSVGNEDMLANPSLLQLDILEGEGAAFQSRFGRSTTVRYISMMNTLCPDRRCPLTTPDGTPMHFDFAHLTEAGSHYLARLLTPEILDR